MMKYSRKNHLNQPEMQGNEVQNKRRESEAQKMHTWQDRIIETESQSGEMMIKNTQNKKENAKNESMLSEQYIHKKNIIQTQSQRGRSMVEMLGVLAIIGVLSIGGITGYKYAMNYYQANQIAHEINLMRTDAQVKIAQGAEELTLGEPYDPINASTLGHIQFSDDYPVIFDCALADDAVINEENISCHVANAYYIEMKNISQEICRPLSKLIQGMNELIGFEITTETIKAENEECQEGANNIHAVFLAEAVSDLISCEENTDCKESENTPYCDKTRHVCVKCYEDNQCAHTEYCEDNTCKSCAEIDERTPVWGGTECVECTESTDCADKTETPVCNRDTNKCVECLTYENCIDKTGTPQCDDESHTCKSCAEIDERTPVWGGTQCVECVESTDCAETLVCKNNECTTCETEAECQAKGTSYHCSNEDTCIQCGANEVWGGKEKGCVECTADSDCTDTPETPACNTDTNKCVNCMRDSDCKNPTPICSEDHTCVACTSREQCRHKNPSEENCTENGACCVAEGMTWSNGECACPADYGISDTTQGKICLPYCKEKEESGLIILIDQSGSISGMVTESGLDKNKKYDKAIEMIETAVGKLIIPEEINAAVYLSSCSDQSSDPAKGCYGSCEGLKIINSHLAWGKHRASEIEAALKIDETDKKISLEHCSGVGRAIRDEVIPLCKTGKEKFLIVIYWDNNDTGVNPHIDKLLQKCPQTKLYNVALSGKPYAGAVGNFNLNNINDLNNDINNALNDAIQQESCVQRPGG